MSSEPLYHIGFSRQDLGEPAPLMALLCGDPERSRQIAEQTPGVTLLKTLSQQRGLNSYLVSLADGRPLLISTSGMGAPSLSIVVNELYQVGIRQIIRVGTVALVEAARALHVPWHLGITASVDTFYEGQERTLSSANPHLLRRLQGITEEYRQLNIANYEMEAATLFKMAGVYDFAAACICAVLADRSQSEIVEREKKEQAVREAIQVALHAALHSNKLPESHRSKPE